MKISTSILSFLIVLSIVFTNCTSSTKTNENPKKLRHLVFFKFKDSASTEEVNAVNNAFIALPESISVIKGFEWGLNNSEENLHQDLTHCYMVTFASEEDRAIYLPHPDHQTFVEKLKPILDKVVVLDYWAN